MMCVPVSEEKKPLEGSKRLEGLLILGGCPAMIGKHNGLKQHLFLFNVNKQ